MILCEVKDSRHRHFFFLAKSICFFFLFFSKILKEETNFSNVFVSWILSLKTKAKFLTENKEIYVDIFKNSTVQIINNHTFA